MYLFLLATLASCQSCSSDYKDVDDIVVEGVETPVPLGDPFIMLYEVLTMHTAPMRMTALKSIPPMI